MLSSKTKRELKIDQRQILIDSIEIGIPSPQQILTWGERVLPNGQKVGLVKNSKTVNYKRFTPFRDGLFCERIFGPVTSFVCACGKKQPHSKVTFCEKCEVEYIDQRSRRYRLGYISLLSPVTHIWYLKGRPSYLSLFLGKRKKTVIALAYCNAYLIEHGISKRYSNQKIDPIWPSIPFPRSGTGVARPPVGFAKAKVTPTPKGLSLALAEPLGVRECSGFAYKSSICTPCRAVRALTCRASLPIFDWQRGTASKSTHGTARLAKRMQFQKPKRRFFQQTLELASSHRIALSQEQRQIGTAIRRLARKGNTRKRTTKFSEQTYGSYFYARQHTLPFLPTFISHFYLRDALLHFLYSRPAYDDTPLEEYCCRKRREPLRDVHKFMAQKTVENSCFHSTQFSKKDLCKNKNVFKRLRSYKSYKTRSNFFTNRTGFRLQNATSCCVSRHPQLNVRLFDLEGQFFNGKEDWQSELAPPITPSFLGDFAGLYGERGGVSNLCRAKFSNYPFYRAVRSRLPWSYWQEDWHTNLLTLLTNRRFAPLALTGHRGSKTIVGQAEARQLQFKASKRICKADWKTRAASAHFFYLASQNKVESQKAKQGFSLSPAPRGSRVPLPIEDSHRQEESSREVQPLCSALPCPFFLPRRGTPCAPMAQRARILTRVKRFVHQCPIPFGGKGNKMGKGVRTSKPKEFVWNAVCRISHQRNRGVTCTEKVEKRIWGRRCSLLLKQPKKEQERVEKEQKRFARFKTKGQPRRGASLSGLELGAIREILSYTGGGALQQILQQFDQHDLCKFLFAEAQILRLLYETHIIDFQNGFIDKNIPSICTPVSTENRASVTARLAIGTTAIKTLQKNSCKKDRDEQNLGLFLPGLSLTTKGLAKAKLTTNGFAKAKLTCPACPYLVRQSSCSFPCTPLLASSCPCRAPSPLPVLAPALAPFQGVKVKGHGVLGQIGARQYSIGKGARHDDVQPFTDPHKGRDGARVAGPDKGGRHGKGKKNKKRIYLTADELQNKINDSRKKRIVRISRRIYKIARRLKVTQLLTRNHRRPEWMILSHLPVLPPDLRPILQMSEKVIVASDLNIMYQRVVYRNNRHLRVRFIDFHLVTAIQRLVQDAVDRLIENGKGGSKPYYTQGGRPLKSLSDILKGKKGRFRLNLLGKRVDFSGRSVIVVSPSCKIHECGLPKDIALELYHYFLLRQLIVKKQCASIVTAKKMIKSKSSLMWDILRELMYHHPVLLNRAPTLHRLGIQAFQPKLVLGNAILLHPLVCSGFNADFDGDQMGVHLPLSFAARSESWDLLWSRNNLLSPATGQPMLVPSQDMVLGFYYITAQSLKGFNSTKRLLVPSFPYRSPSPIPVLAPARPSAPTYLEGARRGACLPSKPFRSSFLLKNEASNFCKAKSCSLRCTHNGKSSTKVTKTEETLLFLSTEEITTAFQNGNIKLHTPIWLYWNAKVENEEVSQIPLELRLHGFGAQQLVYERQIYSNFFTKNRNDNRDKDISNLGNESYRHFYASTILKPSYLICTSPKAYYIRTTPGRILMNSLLEI